MKLWNDLNHAWLALGQRQIDMMQPSQQLERWQRLLSKNTIVEMGNEIVRLSDGLERHALVDYQYGLWEDEIIAGPSVVVPCRWWLRETNSVCSARGLPESCGGKGAFGVGRRF